MNIKANDQIIEVSQNQHNTLMELFITKPDKKVTIGGVTFRVGDLTDVKDEPIIDETPLIEKLKAQGHNTDWYRKSIAQSIKQRRN